MLIVRHISQQLPSKLVQEATKLTCVSEQNLVDSYSSVVFVIY